jgi:diguanylate cyclase (GGDEF)-like protein
MPPTDISADPVTRRVVGWFLLTVAVLAVVACFVYWSTTDLIDQGRRVDHTYEVLVALRDASDRVRDVVAAQRGYLLTGRPEDLAACHADLARIPQSLDRLRRLTADDPGQLRRLDRLEAGVRERLAAVAGVLAAYRRDGLAAARERIRAGAGRREMDDIWDAFWEVEAEERAQLYRRQQTTEAAARATLAVGGACLAGCLGTLAFVFALVRREWSRRRRTEAALERATARLEASLRELREQSIRDPVTGLFNRRYLEKSLGREISRARRHAQPVAVVMADVDHFKRFNDAHGHEAGDAVLAEVGRVLGRHSRREDIACRYGGEEFCQILPGAGAEVARRRAEELREVVARLDVRHGPRRVGPITLSAGVAAYPGRGEESLIASADAALYRAKRAGRDRVVVDEPDAEGASPRDPAEGVAVLPARDGREGSAAPLRADD